MRSSLSPSRRTRNGSPRRSASRIVASSGWLSASIEVTIARVQRRRRGYEPHMSDHEQLGEKADAEADYLQAEVDRLGEDIESAKAGLAKTQTDQFIPAPAQFDTEEDEPEADYPAKG